MHTYFLGLSLLGYDSLWGRMIRSGVAEAVGTVKQTETFPNGDTLQTSFIGIRTFDQFLVPAVIFYNNILSNGSASDRMLLVSLFTTMQTTSHCMLVLGWGGGERPWWRNVEHLFWGVFNQAWGAAAVYPLYCFTHVQQFLEEKNYPAEYQAQAKDPFTPEDAFALIPTAISAAVTPAMLLYPAFNASCTASFRQRLIAFYRFTPLALAVAHPFFTWIQSKVFTLLRWKPRPADSKKYAAASLVISAITAMTGHAYALLNPEQGGIDSVFWPAECIDRTSPTVIADGARDFLQWDVFVITATLVPFSDLILKSSALSHSLRKRSNWFSVFSNSFIGRLALLTFASSVLSPGAVLAFTLAAKVYF